MHAQVSASDADAASFADRELFRGQAAWGAMRLPHARCLCGNAFSFSRARPPTRSDDLRAWTKAPMRMRRDETATWEQAGGGGAAERRACFLPSHRLVGELPHPIELLLHLERSRDQRRAARIAATERCRFKEGAKGGTERQNLPQKNKNASRSQEAQRQPKSKRLGFTVPVASCARPRKRALRGSMVRPECR